MDFLSSLAGFDWLVLLIVGVTSVLGLMRGFIAEVASLAAWVAGVVAVRLFYRPARALIEAAGAPELLAAIAGVLVPFLVALLAVKLAGHLLSTATKDSIIGPFDRLLGLGFGMLKGVLAAGLLFLLITLGLKLLPGREPTPEWLAKAQTMPTLALVAGAMVAYAGEAWTEDGPLSGDDPHKGLPGFGDDETPPGGYDRGDRKSLDKLLDDQEKQTPATAI
jgi:membrane protein required for colicin V production